jgi:hypothetical protein
VQPDFIDEAGQISPAGHGFARAARVDDLFHAAIFPQRRLPVNEAASISTSKGPVPGSLLFIAPCFGQNLSSPDVFPCD